MGSCAGYILGVKTLAAFAAELSVGRGLQQFGLVPVFG
jgi:hypothetical protein